MAVVAWAWMLATPFVKAQTFTQYTTTEGAAWQQSRTSLTTKGGEPMLRVGSQDTGHEFRARIQRNEINLLGHMMYVREDYADAIRLLEPKAQQEVMHGLFAPDGDLHFTRGRLTMNANDYSRAWYSCDTVAGDFGLKYFNIEHDKQNVIRLIKKAQKHQPQMTFWVSPWSPPAWMKINQDYPVLSSQWNKQPKTKDYFLFDGGAVFTAWQAR